jgi:hypothetical protein
LDLYDWLATAPDRLFFPTTQGKSTPFKRELAATQTAYCGSDWVWFSYLKISFLY